MTNLEGGIASVNSKIIPHKEFEKLSLEQKILKLHSEILVAAKQVGIKLPR